jgi:hypothetical protein
MTSHAGRLYSLALALVVFFLAWAVIAAHPWATAKPDPQLAALSAREAVLRQEAKLVQQVVAARKQLATAPAQNTAAAAPAAPQVKVVNLPPLTVTRTS